jgi:m7GpppX diphosphatase
VRDRAQARDQVDSVGRVPEINKISPPHPTSFCSDLTAAHLPLLENLRTKIDTFVQSHYKLNPSQTRVYFHYQPSFYHLHVHVVNVKHDVGAQRIAQAVLLQVGVCPLVPATYIYEQEVIDNIRLLGDYYQRRTLTFVSKLNHPLYKMYAQAGRVAGAAKNGDAAHDQ